MRRLRALFFSNNGLGAGHLARSLAVARALKSKVPELELVLATSSAADALLSAVPVATVRWPAPTSARLSGWSDETRRDVAARVVRGVIEGFRPDVLVTDTFPSGPHAELTGLLRKVRFRALVRRTVRMERARDDVAAAGLAEYQLAIVPGDPGELREEVLPIPTVRVPPITLFEAEDALDRATARRRLGLPLEGRLILVASGGGGDVEAVDRATKIAHALVRDAPGVTPVVAIGPLGRRPALPKSIPLVAETPLQPCLAAFDGVVAPAGYNLSHEVAKAGLPLALYAMPRPYDDQAARAERFEKQGLARVLLTNDDDAVVAAVRAMDRGPRPGLPGGGASRAAEAILELVANS